MKRRHFVGGLAASAALQAFAAGGPKAVGLKTLGKPQSFDYAWLKGQARAAATRPWVDPARPLPPTVDALDWDQHQAIRYRRDHALWADERLRFRAQFFHLGQFQKTPVRIHEVHDGQASELAYDPELFDYGKSGLEGTALPKDLGFAGFRLNFHTDLERDVCAFLGASYFRAVGGEWQYGLSARGLAVDPGLPRPEEFPTFVAFWLERPAPGSSSMVVYALLDSPSITGAYRFVVTPGDRLVMDIDAALYPRKPIERLGIAPLTSMYQTGENDRRMANDWRTEIHDSDGLQMWTGGGEWIWRPLNNPAHLRFSSFADQNPRGFGLLQRDRDFANYQDDGVFYEKRPSLWVEPKSGWDAGSVQLIEIPTVDETFDNIVGLWNPKRPVQAGEELLFAYRLHWGAQPPVQPGLAHCVATRTGLGGVVGQKRKYFSWRFAIDFVGGGLGLLGPKSQVEAVITASQGRVEITSARPQAAINGWRAMFDLVPPPGMEPIDLRLYLSYDGQPLTETWMYQYSPPPANERKFA
jgi:glucans biosynthesis protein